MPELPDVEIFRQVMERHALNRLVRTVDVRAPEMLDGISKRSFEFALQGRTFVAARRWGKNLLLDTDQGGTLRAHFGMSGAIEVRGTGDKDGTYDRVVFGFADGGRLCYTSTRKLGTIGFVGRAEEAIVRLGLGPDALGISRKEFSDLVSSSAASIKGLLMDQERIAGIGNIYSDEILFQARIHPATRAADLDQAVRDDLWRTMRQVLQTAIRKQAVPQRMPLSYLLPHRDTGAGCPRCGGEVKTTAVAGRNAHFCPRCQPAPT
jgi:formamidopyrimidine-DNA glycosylase